MLFPHHSNPNRIKGFTFVEVIVVVSIIGILLPVVFSILTTVAKQQSKIIRLGEVKAQGDYMMAFIKYKLQNNASKIYKSPALSATDQVCDDEVEYGSQEGTDLYFTQKNSNSNYFQFHTTPQVTYDTISFRTLQYNENGTDYQLSSDRVGIFNFDISCLRKNTGTKPFIVIEFTVFYNTDLTIAKPEELAFLNYRSIVSLR